MEASDHTAKLGTLLQTEAEALRNDLNEARALAAEYQREVSAKSNDLALLKQALERALHNLDLLQETLAELRTERHRLASEVMQMTWLQDQVATLRARVQELEQQQANRPFRA